MGSFFPRQLPALGQNPHGSRPALPSAVPAQPWRSGQLRPAAGRASRWKQSRFPARMAQEIHPACGRSPAVPAKNRRSVKWHRPPVYPCVPCRTGLQRRRNPGRGRRFPAFRPVPPPAAAARYRGLPGQNPAGYPAPESACAAGSDKKRQWCRWARAATASAGGAAWHCRAAAGCGAAAPARCGHAALPPPHW